MSSFRQRVQAEARPGESWDEATARLRGTSVNKVVAEEGELADFFVSADGISTKDSRHFMDVALFRMSKRESRAGEVMRHDLADGYIEVKAGPDGMASIWDYDIVLMLISHLTESMNLYKRGRGAMPSRLFTPHVSDILKFCQRGDGGNQSKRIESALDRLKGTTIKRVLHRPSRNSKCVTREVKSESLISGYRVLSETVSGRVDRIEIEAPNWIYREVIDSHGSAVLTVNQDYFLIDSAIARFIYRLARRAAGNDGAKWGFKTIYERSGVTCFKEFCRILRRLIRSDNLPEYHLYEEAGLSGPQLIMTRRSTEPGCG
ncbi:replication initiator protein A [Pseudomonas sp. B14-6]|uniref:replication initiator protein A n=1 Tax=Pseudomonas sp. B14-6 TaxID=2738843 RepID=UPI00155E22B3|nr:replication initiator protein A [Pseudomonas sp. B14-6]QKG68644.1 replication initiator protein A [Pseudomonas sp. B14-6]